eukprot:266097-Chlamydomonas_euryale.AAC.1
MNAVREAREHHLPAKAKSLSDKAVRLDVLSRLHTWFHTKNVIVKKFRTAAEYILDLQRDANTPKPPEFT